MSTRLSSKKLEELMWTKVKDIKENHITMTEPGSLKYLMFGSELSEQSIQIKMGKIGEDMIKYIINETDGLELLKCGVQIIHGGSKKKDLDLIWKDEKNKIIYYREVKGNVDLDSEKLPATLEKIKEIIKEYIIPNYPDYNINTGIFTWSIYDREPIKTKLSKIKKCEEQNIKVEHPKELFNLLNFNWDKKDYLDFFREVGKYIRE